MSSAVETAEGAHEFASQIPVHVSRLADRGTLASLPGAPHRLGHAGYLLFESAVAPAAPGVGSGLCGVRDLGPLVFAPSAHVHDLHRAVSWCGRVVGLDLSLARSQLAAGSCGNATGAYRR